MLVVMRLLDLVLVLMATVLIVVFLVMFVAVIVLIMKVVVLVVIFGEINRREFVRFKTIGITDSSRLFREYHFEPLMNKNIFF